MNSEVIQQVIADQKLMIAGKSRGIPRIGDFSMHQKSGIITVISGIRRSGKTTLTLQIADQFPSFHYIGFDDERLLNFTAGDFDAALIEMKRSGDARVVVMDDVQRVRGWELFAVSLQVEGYKVIVTGNNAKLLDSELARHLAGKYLQIGLFPFSFAECLRYREIDPADNSSDNTALILTAFDEYLLHGGFPEYIKTKEAEVLKRIYDDIVYRELVVCYGIRNVSGFRNLTQYVFTNFTSETGYLPLSKLLGFNSATSVRDYLNNLGDSYLIFELAKYDASLNRQYVSNRKTYVADNGLRNIVTFRTAEDRGRLLENAVFLELKRRGREVWFYKSQNNQEVDFLVDPEKPVLMQVCYDLQNLKSRQKEIASLMFCMNELKTDHGIILTKNEEETVNIGNSVITITPVWKWLLPLQPTDGVISGSPVSMV